MMVFPQDEEKEIIIQIVIVVDAIFKGVGKEEEAKKHYSLASIILVEIYQSLSLCKNGFQFYQGCDILLQWWMTQHMCKKHGNQR